MTVHHIPPGTALTYAELRVAVDIAEHGGSDQDIAERLGLRPFTVKSHLSRMYRKFRIGDRGLLMAVLFRTGVLVERDGRVVAPEMATLPYRGRRHPASMPAPSPAETPTPTRAPAAVSGRTVWLDGITGARYLPQCPGQDDPAWPADGAAVDRAVVLAALRRRSAA